MTIESIDNTFSSHCNSDVATITSRIVRIIRPCLEDYAATGPRRNFAHFSNLCSNSSVCSFGAKDRRPVAGVCGCRCPRGSAQNTIDAMAGWNSKMFRIPVEKSKLRRIRSFQVRHAFHHLKKVSSRKILRHSRNPRNCTCKHGRPCLWYCFIENEGDWDWRYNER